MRSLAILSLIAAPLGAAAQAPVACHPDQEEQISDAPVDLGFGVVYQHLYPGAVGLDDALVMFTDCESGVKILAALPELEDGSQRTVDDVALIFSTALSSGETFEQSDLVDAMTAAGAPAQLRQSLDEDCGCALFYPELRGDKPAWEAE